MRLIGRLLRAYVAVVATTAAVVIAVFLVANVHNLSLGGAPIFLALVALLALLVALARWGRRRRSR